METLIEKLAELRKDKNLTQQEIADYLKIDRSNYSKYERGKLEINISMLKSLAIFYGVSTDYLLGLED